MTRSRPPAGPRHAPGALAAAALLAAALAVGASAALPASAVAAGSAPGAGAPPAPGALREAFRNRYVGKPAPSFVLKDLKGRPARLSDYRGKIVLLNFWFSGCGPCRMETPDLMQLHGLYKEKGLAVLGINLDAVMIPQEQGRMLKAFLSEFPVPYPVLLGDAKVYQDYGGVPVQPISFLLDRDGVVVRLFWGAFPGAAYDRAIRPYLAGRGERPPAPGP